MTFDWQLFFWCLQDIAADNKVTVMPTFIMFKNKQKVDEFSGANETKLMAYKTTFDRLF